MNIHVAGFLFTGASWLVSLVALWLAWRRDSRAVTADGLKLAADAAKLALRVEALENGQVEIKAAVSAVMVQCAGIPTLEAKMVALDRLVSFRLDSVTTEIVGVGGKIDRLLEISGHH